jgi:hypothetical protein
MYVRCPLFVFYRESLLKYTMETMENFVFSIVFPDLGNPGTRCAAKVINYFSAVCCTLSRESVTAPSCRTFLQARGVFIFVRNFSRGENVDYFR